MRKIKSKCSRRRRCSVVKAILRYKLRGDLFLSPLRSFMTPLHVAAERAHNDVMEVLHKHGAKVKGTPEIRCQSRH